MPHDTAPQGPQIITALKGADDLSLAVLRRGLDEHRGDALERFFAEIQMRQRVFSVGVEAGGDQEQLGAELIRARGGLGFRNWADTARRPFQVAGEC